MGVNAYPLPIILLFAKANALVLRTRDWKGAGGVAQQWSALGTEPWKARFFAEQKMAP